MNKLYKYLFGLLALSYSFSLIYQFVIVTNYQINKEEITEAFCVNKDKPELKCNGKCHLKKQLKVTNSDPKIDNQKYVPSFNLMLLTAFNQIEYSKVSIDADKLDAKNYVYFEHYEFIYINNSSPPPEA